MLKNKLITYCYKSKYFSCRISIDYRVYKLDIEFFDLVFNSFNRNQNDSNKSENIYVIFDTNTTISDNIIFIKPNYIDWKFQFLIDLENKLSNKISKNSIIFHASAIEHNGNGIMFCGERYSGKTTITQKLLIESSSKYIDDDMVILSEKNIWGFSFPAKLRINHGNSYIIKESSTQNRYLINYSNISKSPVKIKHIIFPQYSLSKFNEIKQIFGSQAYFMLIQNIKGGEGNLKILNEQLINICNSTKFWTIKYSNNDFMMRKIIPIINGNY